MLGASVDDQAAQSSFKEKLNLPYKLLADTTKEFSSAFGVLADNGMCRRITVVIDEQGVVTKVYPDVNPDGHVNQVMADLGASPS